MPFAATPRDYLSEEIQKERQTPYNITYMWNLIYHTNELIYKTWKPGVLQSMELQRVRHY